MKMKFYRCNVCGQILAQVSNISQPAICCDEVMEELVAKDEDKTVGDKHVPIVKLEDRVCSVYVGKEPHPSSVDHYIEWIAIQTSKGNQRKCLEPGDAPMAVFYLDDDEIVENVYVYCNIHELWKAKEIPNGLRRCPTCGCFICRCGTRRR